MKRLLPDSVAGRTLGVLLLGLTVSHVLSMGLYLTDRATTLAFAGGEHVAERIVTVTRLIERTPPPERRRLVELADSPSLRVTWSPSSAIGNGSDGVGRAGVLRRALISHFGDGSERRFRVRAADPGGSGPWEGPAGRGGGPFVVSLQLADGTWLNFLAPLEVPQPFWSLRFLLSLAVMVAAIIALSALVVFHLTAPLGAFARAAQRLGVDVGAPPLPETGPAEVRRASRAFNEMQARIRRFVEDRTQMLAAISHDLRTPIMRLRLRAEFIEDEEERGRTLADLDDMERMIASTLSFARDDASTEARETVDLVALVRRVCDSVADAGFAVEFEGSGRLAYACRPNALRRALTNLVENAAHYGDKARVELLGDERRIVVRIDDEGLGIPEDQVENIFKPFFRLEASRSRDGGGTGLGLTVARTIVRAHGGDIGLENRPGGGLRVEVSLPR